MAFSTIRATSPKPGARQPRADRADRYREHARDLALVLRDQDPAHVPGMVGITIVNARWLLEEDGEIVITLPTSVSWITGAG